MDTTDKARVARIENLTKVLAEQRRAGKSPEDRLPTLGELRTLLVASIDETDLDWFDLELRQGDRGFGKKATYTVKVCSPVRVGGFWVPVTVQETWDKTVKFKALPLSVAVADQQLNEAAVRQLFVEFKTQPAGAKLRAFDEYSDTLGDTKYASEAGCNPVAGSHKLWVLSSLLTDTNACNYGFVHKGRRLPDAQGSPGK
jgi:hypothetical protein